MGYRPWGNSRCSRDCKITVTPGPGQRGAGFYEIVSVDIARTTFLDIDIPGAPAGYDLLLKLPDGKAIPVLTGQAAGPWRSDLRLLLPAGTRDFQVSFRVYGPTVFGQAHFMADTAVPPATGGGCVGAGRGERVFRCDGSMFRGCIAGDGGGGDCGSVNTFNFGWFYGVG